MRHLTVRPAVPSDLDQMRTIWRASTGRDLRGPAGGLPAAVAVADGHGADGLGGAEGKVVGFAYTARFGPDVLELDNIFVSDGLRGQGVGQQLLTDVERTATDGGWSGIVLVNSLAYEGPDGKRFADRFYQDAGYECALDTGTSKVRVKHLR